MKNNLIREIGNDLIMRRSTLEDVEHLAAFVVQVQSDGTDLDSRCLDAWTRDLLSGKHPTFDVGDFTIVEDTKKNKIVSCMNLISQTWTYDGIPFGVGRPELVGTDPDYRRRGLVRQQFEEVHRWSKERGELIQVITGIPNYYRQFGYEMTLNLGGGRAGSASQVPVLAQDQKETFTIRPAIQGDSSFILELMTSANRRYPLAALWTRELLEYEISGKSAYNINRRELRIIENNAAHPVGFLAYWISLKDSRLTTSVYELNPGVSWLEATPKVIRYLWEKGGEIAGRDGGSRLGFSFGLGEAHPAYQVIPHRLPVIRRPYAWFIRVPDLPSFLRKITPALEQRLEKSYCCGFHGALKISFYNSGISMVFEHGKITDIQPLGPTQLEKSGASFPGLTFLQIVFGHKSLDEIKAAFPDCNVEEDHTAPLLNALFPRQSSHLWDIS